MKRVWLFAVMIMLLSLNVGLANKAIVPSDVQSFNDELKEHLAAQKARIELGKRTFETILRKQGQEQMLTGDDYDEALSNFFKAMSSILQIQFIMQSWNLLMTILHASSQKQLAPG